MGALGIDDFQGYESGIESALSVHAQTSMRKLVYSLVPSPYAPGAGTPNCVLYNKNILVAHVYPRLMHSPADGSGPVQLAVENQFALASG